jgi:hypothetical protein
MSYQSIIPKPKNIILHIIIYNKHLYRDSNPGLIFRVCGISFCNLNDFDFIAVLLSCLFSELHELPSPENKPRTHFRDCVYDLANSSSKQKFSGLGAVLLLCVGTTLPGYEPRKIIGAVSPVCVIFSSIQTTLDPLLLYHAYFPRYKM